MTGGSLPHWLERWLGVKENAAGDATRWRLEHSWPWPPWATLLAALVLLLGVVWYYRRETAGGGPVVRRLLAALRCSAFLVLALMIAEISLALHRTGLPTLLLLVDDSRSMNIADRYADAKQLDAARAAIRRGPAASSADKPTRFELAKSLLGADDSAWLRSLAEPYRLKCYWAGESARPLSGSTDELAQAFRSATAAADATRLGDCLRSALADQRGTPPAAVILLTDGVTTEGEPLSAAASLARRKGVPLFVVGLGSEAPVRDLELADLLVDDEVFVDDAVDFHVRLRGVGLSGRHVQVKLRQSGQTEALAKSEVAIRDENRLEDVHLLYRPTAEGEFDYEVLVEPLAEESSLDNNQLVRHVVVRREQIRVLLADGYPRYEFRYLKHLLERDSTIRLQTYLHTADAEYAAEDRTAVRVFPVRREELIEQDVVVLGDLSPADLSHGSLAGLRELVEQQGGGLVLIAGERHNPLSYRDSPLAPLFPIDLSASQHTTAASERREGLTLQPTELGLATRFLQLADTQADSLEAWRKLPPLYWFVEAPAKPSAQVLAEHRLRTLGDGQKAPLIVLQYAGAGKVVFHAVDETWRWRYRVGDVYFARYWIQLIRYLSRSKLLGRDRGVDFTVDRREYRRGEPVQLRVRFFEERRAPAEDDGVTIVIEQPAGRERAVRLSRRTDIRGLFEGQADDLEEGLHHARLAAPAASGRAPSVDFRIVAPPGELAFAPMAAAELQQAARETRGKFYRLADAGRLLTDLPPGRQAPIETLPPAPLWNQWWMLLAFLALLVTEWLLRKRLGMV